MAQQWRDRSEVFHRRAKEYDSWFDNSLLFAIETAAVRALAIGPQDPALEIGVGPGRFARELGSGFGIDPAFAPLQLSRIRGVSVCQAIGEALPFQDNSFATVSLFFTFCFLQEPDKALQEARRVLQKDGHLILGFVPSTGAWGKSLQQKKEAGHPFYQHARLFTVAELETRLKKQKFALQAAVSSLFQPPGEVNEIETPLAGADEQAGFVVLAAQAKDRE